MTSLRYRVLMLLAAGETPNAEFEAFCASLTGDGGTSLVSDARSIRGILFGAQPISRKASGGREPRHLAYADELGDREPGTGAQKLVSEVRRLLVDELGMPVGTAVNELANALGYTKGLPQRKSFELLIARLVDAFGPSLVLSAAQRVRNESMPRRAMPDWPLREGQNGQR